MKRWLFTVFLWLVLFIPAYSQIQNRFLGCELGNEVYPLCQYVENNYKGGLIGPAYRSFMVGQFAGINWDIAEFNYPNGLFADITFIKRIENKKLAFYFFSNLKERLDKKYIQYRVENDIQKVLYDDGRIACMLICEYEQVSYGAMFWCLRLYYGDKTLSKNPIEKQDEEL